MKYFGDKYTKRTIAVAEFEIHTLKINNIKYAKEKIKTKNKKIKLINKKALLKQLHKTLNNKIDLNPISHDDNDVNILRLPEILKCKVNINALSKEIEITILDISLLKRINFSLKKTPNTEHTYIEPEDFSGFWNFETNLLEHSHQDSNIEGILNKGNFQLDHRFNIMNKKYIEFNYLSLEKYNKKKNSSLILGNNEPNINTSLKNNTFGFHKKNFINKEITLKKKTYEKKLSYDFKLTKKAKVEFKLNSMTIFRKILPPGHYSFSDYPYQVGLNKYSIYITEDYKNNNQIYEKIEQSLYIQNNTIPHRKLYTDFGLGIKQSNNYFYSKNKNNHISTYIINKYGISNNLQYNNGLFLNNIHTGLLNAFTYYKGEYTLHSSLENKYFTKEQGGHQFFLSAAPIPYFSSRLSSSIRLFSVKKFFKKSEDYYGFDAGLSNIPFIFSSKLGLSIISTLYNENKTNTLDIQSQLFKEVRNGSLQSIIRYNNKYNEIQSQSKLTKRFHLMRHLFNVSLDVNTHKNTWSSNLIFSIHHNTLPIKNTYNSEGNTLESNGKFSLYGIKSEAYVNHTTNDKRLRMRKGNNSININSNNEFINTYTQTSSEHINSQIGIETTNDLNKSKLSNLNLTTSKGNITFTSENDSYKTKINSSLILIGDRLSLSKRIDNSFVTFKEIQGKHKKIKVNKTTSWFGHPILNISGKSNKITLNTIYNKNRKIFTEDYIKHIKNPRKKGYIFNINYLRNLNVRAQLVNEFGDPIEYKMIKTYSPDPSVKNRYIMTGKNGHLFLNKVKPATYFLYLDDPAFETIKINIENSKNIIINKGKLIIPYTLNKKSTLPKRKKETQKETKKENKIKNTIKKKNIIKKKKGKKRSVKNVELVKAEIIELKPINLKIEDVEIIKPELINTELIDAELIDAELINVELMDTKLIEKKTIE